jgi:hypothetical protein
MFEDEDITALMPVKGEDFEAGVCIPSLYPSIDRPELI